MKTPVFDFVTRYCESGMSRLHMPGHKGKGPLGIESRDITEIRGADVLSEAEGIIGESEAEATRLFGSGRSFYLTEGSSQGIRAMLFLALKLQPPGRPAASRPLVLAARNVHRAMVSALALLDADAAWIYPEQAPEKAPDSVCSCHPTAAGVRSALTRLKEEGRLPFAVYITSPDYLGMQAPVREIAEVSHAFGVPLLVDNAHGAYLHFLETPCHPMDLGADLCCDSAHKTLPCLTGGAYLHLSPQAASRLPASLVRSSLVLFGSTSPSYLTLQSLDLVNAALAGDWPGRLRETARRVRGLREYLRLFGHEVLETEPLKLTFSLGRGAGTRAADQLRRWGVEPEFSDVNYVVLMFSPDNTALDYQRVREFIRHAGSPGKPPAFDQARLSGPAQSEQGACAPAPDIASSDVVSQDAAALSLCLRPLEQAISVREAVFLPQEEIDVRKAAGRIMGAVTVSCPPAVPIAVSGERITEDLIPVFLSCGIETVSVIV